MKKSFIAVFTVALCFLIGCLAGCAPKGSTDESTKLSAPYAAEDMETVLFTDAEKALTLDVSDNQHLKSLLLATEYYEYEPSQNDSKDAKYILSLHDREIRIYVGGVVRFIFTDAERQEKTAVVLNNEFAYLDTIAEGGAVAFNGYTATQNIKVYDAENVGGEITEKDVFLESLQGLRFVRLNNKAHYQTGAATYTLQIGNDEIAVYHKFVTLNGDLYIIHQGNFEFLKDLKFSSSSDWLPWL